MKPENVEVSNNIHAKDQQMEKCQNTINHPRKQYVNHARKPSLENIVMVARKHTSKDNDRNFDYIYYITSVQRREITTKRQWTQEKFLESKRIVVIENLNRIHAFIRFEEDDHVEKYKCHFRLIDLPRDGLHNKGVPTITE